MFTRLGNRVIVIGAGNAAMDVARTAIRHARGISRVLLVQSRTAMSTSKLCKAGGRELHL